jgi:hypothetical protein
VIVCPSKLAIKHVLGLGFHGPVQLIIILNTMTMKTGGQDSPLPFGLLIP